MLSLKQFLHSLKFSKKITKLIGSRPGNIKLYELAFTHRSATIVLDDGSHFNNERLEFLGDSILGAIITDYLFNQFLYRNEGNLSKMRAKIVNRDFLNSMAQKMGMQNYLISHLNGSLHKKHVYGNTLEALIGTIYIDKGFKKTRKFVHEKIIKPYVDPLWIVSDDSDYKSLLMQWGQKNKQEISFDNIERRDDKLNHPVFISSVKIMNNYVGAGTGLTKKEAQQHAAKLALENISQ